MPEPNTHIAAGIATAYAAGKFIGLDADFLIIGLVGALLASARETPQPFQCTSMFLLCKLKLTARVVLNLCAVSFFAASSTAIALLLFPKVEPVGAPIAGLVGFFGTVAINSITEFMGRAWKVALTRLGGSASDVNDH